MTEGEDDEGGGNNVITPTEDVVKPFLVKNGKCTTCDGKVPSSALITCRVGVGCVMMFFMQCVLFLARLRRFVMTLC